MGFWGGLSSWPADGHHLTVSSHGGERGTDLSFLIRPQYHGKCPTLMTSLDLSYFLKTHFQMQLPGALTCDGAAGTLFHPRYSQGLWPLEGRSLEPSCRL